MTGLFRSVLQDNSSNVKVVASSLDEHENAVDEGSELGCISHVFLHVQHDDLRPRGDR
jgi:hypothetical protein